MKVAIAKAGEATLDFNVFTVEALQDLAAHDHRCTFDERNSDSLV